MNNQKKIDEDRFISGIFWGVLMGVVTAMLTLPKTLKQLRRENQAVNTENSTGQQIVSAPPLTHNPLAESALEGQSVARRRRAEFGFSRRN